MRNCSKIVSFGLSDIPLSYCESVEFAILKRQGEDIAVRDKLRERWQRQTTDGGRTLNYTRTLISKEHCPHLLEIYDDNISLMRFSGDEQRLEFEQQLIKCLLILDYRNRLDNTLNSYLGFEVSRSQLLSMLQVLRDAAPNRLKLFATA